MKSVIHIFGASGSGTATLAKKISEGLGHKMMDIPENNFVKVKEILDK